MARQRTADEYGDRQDGVEARLSDEEAQLLDAEDFEQFELDETETPYPLLSRGQHAAEDQDSASRPRGRRRNPGRLLPFLYGPDPPKVHAITPLWPSVQELPAKWLARALPPPWQRTVLAVLFLLAWAVSLAVPVFMSNTADSDASGDAVRLISCVDTLWRGNNECGLDGVDCRPFSNTSFSFRCPAGCAGARVPGTHYVGPLDVGDQPHVVGGGGGGPYRGDSFICGAAVHAGVIDDATGGCGLATLVGEYYQYFASSRHGIDSIAFGSSFPLSFTVAADPPTVRCPAPDRRWTVSLPLSLLFTVLLSLFTTSPSLLFFATFTGIFTHLALVSDPPDSSSPTSSTLPVLLSTYTARLAPALITAALLYLTTARRALAGLPAGANFEKTLLWLGPLWLAALLYDTALASLRRVITSRDAPGTTASSSSSSLVAVIAPAALAAAALAAAVVQARTLRREGRLPPYLAYYALVSALGACLAILSALAAPPDASPTATTTTTTALAARPHGAALALLLLPGTAAQTRPSLALQGLLLGAFVHGAARDGFDGPGGMFRFWDGGEAPSYGEENKKEKMLPEVVAPLIERLGRLAGGGVATGTDATAAAVSTVTTTGSSNGNERGGGGGGGGGEMRISFKWRALASPAPVLVGGRRGRRVEGISVLVNDVERYRGWFAERPLEEQVFTWTRKGGGRGGGVVADEYFRFGFVTDGGKALGYSEAGTWFVNGSWSQGAGYW